MEETKQESDPSSMLISAVKVMVVIEGDGRQMMQCPHCKRTVGSFTNTHFYISTFLSTRNKFVGDCNGCGHQVRWFPASQPKSTVDKPE